MLYRTILINPKQRNLQRIVWCESEHESPKIYELSTVTYGTVSAHYLAQRTLTQLSMDEEANFPIAASVLRNNLYMDDVLYGAATLEEAIVLRQQLKGILKSAGMELHKLCANHEKLSPDPKQNYNFATLTETKTLGVLWKPNLDCFLIKVKVCLDSSDTKRDVLSTIAKIFDPIGLMAPVISKAKIFLQQVIEIHGFADASERCYGAAVYCKSKNLKSETLVRLITSKSRVAPIKSLTIPKLELCAAVLLAKLVKRVVAALQLETAELYLWSDSMIVLAWLRKEPMDLKTFVQNRVAKIQELYPNQLWRHVPSDQNPADLVFRGVDPEKLLQQNLWFNGPTFLSGDDYPNRTINCREKLDEYNSELKNCVNEQIENFQSVLNIHVNDFLNDLLNLSNNYITILRVLSFIFRFVENLKGINKVAGPLTTKEFEKAETYLVKKVQEQEFSSDINHLKTVHIELVLDLTSQAFIAALKRFMARRGKCAKLFSDNGKNFVGASNEIKKLLEIVRKPDEKLANYLAAEGIQWKFIPARSPNFGGLWEAAIKSCKYHLKRVVNGINLTYEELLTVTVQIEGILNSRPLCPLSNNDDDFQVLTPAHFLINRSLNSLEEPNLTKCKESNLKKWQKITKIVQLMWKFWSRNYLNQLQQRGKWMFEKNNVKIGDLVLIIEENLPTYKWALGRIVELYYGEDKKVRVVKIKTQYSTCKRAISKICVLPMEDP
ncbi:integrase catalytic domain-containing protein [Trichonephila clavipes]|uniref:Integrase catalytic domain-containing protein n=1 Tax=Trichonephila clavipes TaxID=2585209 RepID=A0A8X6WES8_TRICX|nr:integrase catalytic domain-containing protein [Trichonephila clavipes]